MLGRRGALDDRCGVVTGAAIELKGLNPKRGVGDRMRAALLAHDLFGPTSSKTATCILRYRRRYEPVAVIDRSKAGRDAGDFVGDIGRGVPVVAGLKEALRLRPEVLVIGIAPIGGKLPSAMRDDIRVALENGIEVHSGLHTFIGDDPEFGPLAAARNLRIWDVRRPSRPDRIATGAAGDVKAFVVHTMGSDCSSGKMTTSVELVDEARRRGLSAGLAATGQTGIMIGAEAGAPIDRIISDFVAGAAEELVTDLDAQGVDLVSVEGQGSITHPAYSAVTVGLAHGCRPDAVVYCHVAGRTHYSGFDKPPHEVRLMPIDEGIDLVNALLAPVGAGRVVAVSLATFHLSEQEARREIQRVEEATGLPVTDPVRFGPGVLLDAVLEMAHSSRKPGGIRLSGLTAARSR